MSSYTYEKKKATKNSVVRISSVGLFFIIEILVWWLLLRRLQGYQWVTIITRILAILAVIAIVSQEKTSSLKTPWIMLILAFPAFGLFLYVLVGTNGHTRKMKARYRDIDNKLFPLLPNCTGIIEEMKVQDLAAAGIASYIQNISRYPIYNDSDIEYFDSAEKALEDMLYEMEKAEKFIFMEYFAIQDAVAWESIQMILESKVKSGVEVRLFYDDMGSIGFVNFDFSKKLNALGINCRVFNPAVPGINMFLNNRDHRKLTVIDGKVGFTGGYNIADEYFNLTHPYGEWKDTGVKITGNAVKNLTLSFLEMWNAVRAGDKDDCDFIKYLPENNYVQKEQGVYIAPYADTPMDNIHVGEDVYISMINKAERYCYITTPYLIITDEMIHALGLAARRGVDVRIVTPGIPDKKIIYSVTRSFYNALAEKGIRIYEWTPGFCHAKMSIVDDKMATCGTINLDYRSLYHHFENGCFFFNADAIKDMKTDIDNIISQSTEVTEKYGSDRSKPLRFSQLVLRIFAALL